MEAVFAEAYVPASLRETYLRGCAELEAAANPGLVWVKCLSQLLSLAANNPAVETVKILRACEASAETLAEGFSAGKVPAATRQNSITVAAKICAWLGDREPLVAWLRRQLVSHGLIPSGVRLGVEVARELCEKATTFQGLMRREPESKHLGLLLLRLVSVGCRGNVTLRMLWQTRGSQHMRFTLRYRSWALLSGLADAGVGTLQTSVDFDADLWMCAAVERPCLLRRNILQRLLAHFRLVMASPKPLKCTSKHCLATTSVHAAFAHTYAPEPALIKAVGLFVNAEHAARGCPCSPWRDAGGRGGTMPAWGGNGSSGLAMVARQCRDLNTRSNALNKLGYNPTDDVLNAVAGVFSDAVQDRGPATSKTITGLVVAEHTKQAVAVLAAAPFLRGDEPAPWRLKLLAALRGRQEYWLWCMRKLPYTCSQIQSRHYAWMGPGPIHNLLEAAAAARAFAATNQTPGIQWQSCIIDLSPEQQLLEAMDSALGVLSWKNTTLGSYVAAWLQAKSQSSHSTATLAAVELMLQHPQFPLLALQGRYVGTWQIQPTNVIAPETLQAATQIGPGCAALLRREAGLWTIKPKDFYRGWWHLGVGFSKAALTFMAALQQRRLRHQCSLPNELAVLVLANAACQVAPLRLP